MTGHNRTEGPLQGAVERLRGDLDRWMDVARSQGERALDLLGLRGNGGPFPPLDVIETPDEFLVRADVPGLSPEAVEVTLAGNMLTLRGEKPATPAEIGHVVHRSERPTGRFARSIPLPAPVNPEAVTAEARDGVLHIRLQKIDRTRARQIAIQVGAPQPDHPVPPAQDFTSHGAL